MLFIMNVNARFPGATNDSAIFGESDARDRMIELHEEAGRHLLGQCDYVVCNRAHFLIKQLHELPILKCR